MSAAERDIIEKKIANLLETLNAKLHHVNRHLRQAALIWLFTLVKRCAVIKLNCIMSDLTSLQHAFINGLTETNGSYVCFFSNYFYLQLPVLNEVLRNRSGY